MVLVCGSLIWGCAEGGELWRIGVEDDSGGEFALGPGGYADFGADSFFVVGRGEWGRDWSYVHPGPADAWAGSRGHRFGVVFGARGVAAEGECRLVLDFVDTQGAAPPELVVWVNDHAVRRRLPAGAGDASVRGEPAKGREFVWEVPFPMGWLVEGDNWVEVESVSGSWALYDSLWLEVPDGVDGVGVSGVTRMRGGKAAPVLLKGARGGVQPVTLSVQHAGEGGEGVIRLGEEELIRVGLVSGVQRVEVGLPEVARVVRRKLELEVGGKVVASCEVEQGPVVVRDVWVLPHSHVDIGYTHPQAETLDIQVRNIAEALELSKASAGNPEGERFKWNPEAIWGVEAFLERATAGQRAEFVAAVKRGDMGVDALYGNMLTGLCRPEELVACLSYAQGVASETGVPVESAAICDVPGWTWGLTTVFGQSGVKYFAIGPNYSARIGRIHLWDNKPFYWVSPSGKERVLCYVVDNYHFLGNLEEQVLGQVGRLGRSGYAYAMAPVFWVGQWENGGVDNAPPDGELVAKVRSWNEKYAVPRVRVGLIREFFGALEARHGAELPEHAGDLTPYWEDGAGSTARETAMNRASAERLVQAETLQVLLGGESLRAKVAEAWRKVLLYSEHTWGAWCSISDPDSDFTRDQWEVKRGFAEEADRLSREVMEEVVSVRGGEFDVSKGLEVVNLGQWDRTGLVRIPGVEGGVVDLAGDVVPSQVLASGDLGFVARDVPSFGSRIYRLSDRPGRGQASAGARVEGNALVTSGLRVEVDELTGDIRSVRLAGLEHEFVDQEAGLGLNAYRYVLGADVAGARGNGSVEVRVLESGPVVASLEIRSRAPGCRELVREVRVVEGLDWVECVNRVDREAVREKDSVHFGFPFGVGDGVVRMETPWAVVRPGVDQLPGSCFNWYTVQRWVDVSGDVVGVTWAPVDVPLVQVGGMTANLMGAVGWDEWMIKPLQSSHLYSWAQNNHWFTNYKADQPGVTEFRYVLRPHRGGYSAMESARFGLETTRPLVALPVEVGGDGAGEGSLFTVTGGDVQVESLWSSDDGSEVMLRLYGVTGAPQSVKLEWLRLSPGEVWLTDLHGRRLERVNGPIQVPGYGVVTLSAKREAQSGKR